MDEETDARPTAGVEGVPGVGAPTDTGDEGVSRGAVREVQARTPEVGGRQEAIPVEEPSRPV